MSSLINNPTMIPAINENLTTINPGEKWPLPYRGSRYSIKKIKNKLKLCWTRLATIHYSDEIPNGLIKAMKDYKGDLRGSFRVTPYKEVITKKEIENGIWKPIYLGKLEGLLLFPGFDLNPSNITIGNLWRGLHFKHGEEFAVWNRDGNDDYLYWAFRGLYFRSIEKYPEICAKVREIRPRCGRIYITEFNHIWMNLPGSEVSYKWDTKFRKLLLEDKLMLSKNDILLRSVFERVNATQTYPVYLGNITKYDSGNAPRTHFSSSAKFGIGGEDIDDGENFHGKSWKKMRRDY